MRLFRHAALAVTLSLATAGAAAAQQQAAAAPATVTRSGVTLPTTTVVDGHTLTLNGMALRKKAIFKVYVAGFYLPAKSSDADAIIAADQPRRMVLEFVRNVSKDQMCDAMNEGLAKNTTSPSAELSAKFGQFCGMMAPVEKGQQFVFTYVPGQGTTVEVAKKKTGTIQGKDFADALFRSWIGPNPGPGQGFKKDILDAKS
jgi:hypothetical protein